MEGKLVTHVLAYLGGFVIGELAMLASWGLQQPAGTSPARYLPERWPHVLLSACVAAAGCLIWSEGSLVQHLPEALPFTLGLTVVAGGVLTYFAHKVVQKIAARSGLGGDA